MEKEIEKANLVIAEEQGVAVAEQVQTDENAMHLPTETKLVPDETLEVYNKIKEGYTQAEIRTMFARWKPKKFKAIWTRTQAIIAKDMADTEEARANAILRYNDLYKQAMAVGNIKEAKNILDSLCKVQGLNRDVQLNAEFVTVWKQ